MRAGYFRGGEDVGLRGCSKALGGGDGNTAPLYNLHFDTMTAEKRDLV